MIAGDPALPGPFTLRLEVPADTIIAPHTPAKVKSVTILSGAIYHETGEKLDKTKGSLLTTGGFVSLPAEMAHSLWTVKTTMQQEIAKPEAQARQQLRPLTARTRRGSAHAAGL